MHCVVSWDIVTEGSPAREEIEAELVDVLGPYNWVRPLNGIFIVPVGSDLDRLAIWTSFQTIETRYKGRVFALVSPMIAPGVWTGVHDPAVWPLINERST